MTAREGMRKLLVIVPLIVLIVFLTGCGKTAKPASRSVDVIGSWTVKNPPKPSTKGFPQGYVPPTPTYVLTFTSDNGEDKFVLVRGDESSDGTYILSGATIQLIPSGVNFMFEFGKTKEEDKILGDGLVWVREGTGTNSQPTPSTPSNPQPTPTPTSTPNTPTPIPPSPNGPTPPPPPPNQ